MATTVITPTASFAAASTRRTGVAAVAAVILDKLFTWQARFEQRQQLKALEPHLLSDLGLSQSDVRKELNKPFWQA
ncbi:DUF1127 domain-containing protein [Rhodovibrionaceae bacterium A322]